MGFFDFGSLVIILHTYILCQEPYYPQGKMKEGISGKIIVKLSCGLPTPTRKGVELQRGKFYIFGKIRITTIPRLFKAGWMIMRYEISDGVVVGTLSLK